MRVPAILELGGAAIAAALVAWCAAKSAAGECYLTRFGRECLAGVDVVAEVRVGAVRKVGLGVEVASLEVEAALHDHLPARERRERGLLVFAHEGEFAPGTRLLVFLTAYGAGGRYEARIRLPELDRDYSDKVRVSRGYIAVEGIPDLGKRREALKTLLLENIGDRSDWVRWNAVSELEELVGDPESRFGREDLKRIDAVLRPSPSLRQAYKEALARVRAAVEERVKEHPEEERS